MEAWGIIFVGEQTTHDDGSTEERIYAAEQFKATYTTIDKSDPKERGFKTKFNGLTKEAANIVKAQMNRMRDNIIIRAKAGDDWRKRENDPLDPSYEGEKQTDED